MKQETVRYTATLPLAVVNELKEMASGKEIPSVNYVIQQALEEYLKCRKAEKYAMMMKEAGLDKVFLARTMSCLEDFSEVDGEVSGEW